MRLPGWTWLLLTLLVAGCATPRTVHLDTGRGKPRVFTPPADARPVEISPDAFTRAIAELLLNMPLPLQREPLEERVVLTSWENPHTLAATGRAPTYRPWCKRQENPEDCLSLLGNGFILDARGRRDIALSFAWDAAWDGATEASQEAINPIALKSMLTSVLGAYMDQLTAPRPITQGIAIAISAYLVAYLGTDAVWALVKAWGPLTEAAAKARSFAELEKAGRRFGEVLGDNGTRVLVLVSLTALGGRTAMATKGPRLPGFPQAVLAAKTQAGFHLGTAATGGVRSIGLTEKGLHLELTPAALAPPPLSSR
ncbi:hypothetical protein [Stigmatella aurantiaca]|uniref:Lipoprotein n=1 Tax=Stigmatella aurantiaca (strain DW4/3-1) TaxID=378806 RepID=Q08PS3_STIAD|nr:hypothetical protein [Stigmatella aurantiaca]ADO67968.1 uncharacterized protein STAUR_0159 [Stigmatella aurantiaca DW4/3-1]EAU62482.1 hypothetical protein STIAU_2843 [Stigmatella aurantiaca DW4/3-1]